jgi:hypothetical protein
VSTDPTATPTAGALTQSEESTVELGQQGYGEQGYGGVVVE